MKLTSLDSWTRFVWNRAVHSRISPPNMKGVWSTLHISQALGLTVRNLPNLWGFWKVLAFGLTTYCTGVNLGVPAALVKKSRTDSAKFKDWAHVSDGLNQTRHHPTLTGRFGQPPRSRMRISLNCCISTLLAALKTTWF